jgi:hypothetical protein|tara:strand:- start:1519 stop:1902 length:384 start_codon:yes stop_codon:yes gene_type:complete
MGRYYYGDIEGKFMFAVQPSDAGERFGAYEVPIEPEYLDYKVERNSYDDICNELESIEDSGAVKRVKHMWSELEKEGQMGYNQDDMKRFKVSDNDMSEYADWLMGKQMKDYFDENPDAKWLNFNAEL